MLIAFTIAALFPIYFMVVSALKTNSQFASNELGVPAHPTFNTLHEAFAGGSLARLASELGDLHERFGRAVDRARGALRVSA